MGWMDDLQGDKLYGPDGSEVLPRTAGTQFTGAPVTFNPATNRREVAAGSGGGGTISQPVTLFAQDWYEPNQTTSPPATNAAGLTIDSVDTDFAVRQFLYSGPYGALTEIAVPVGATSLALTICARLTVADTIANRTLIWTLGARPIGSAWVPNVASVTVDDTVPLGVATFASVLNVTVAALGIAAGECGVVQLYRTTGTSQRTANLYWTRWNWS